MGEGRPGDGLHVVRGHEVTARHGGPRAGDLQQGQRAPRARADLDLAVTPRRPHDVDHVPLDGGIDVDVLDRGLQPPHLVRRGHRFDRGVVRPALPPAFADLDLLFPRRIAERDQEVSSAEDRPEHPFEDGPLADDDGFHGVKEGSADRGHGREVHRQASMRASTSWNSRVKPPRSRARRTQAYRPSRSPARTWRNSARTGSPNTRRRASGSCCTAYIPAGVRPNDSRACSRKAARAREVTRTWLYSSPRAARRTDAATVSSSPGSYASGEAGRTSGAGSDVPRKT